MGAVFLWKLFPIDRISLYKVSRAKCSRYPGVSSCRACARRSPSMFFRNHSSLAAFVLAPLAALVLHGQGVPRDGKPSETGDTPPKTWVDKDTGHRVWRVSDEPNSGAFYFNVNAYTPDGKQMVYNSPGG